jgi:hypothetical protein
MKEIGKYFLVRVGWRCNMCGKMFWTNKKTKPHCASAPYLFSDKTICEIPKSIALRLKKANQ